MPQHPMSSSESSDPLSREGNPTQAIAPKKIGPKNAAGKSVASKSTSVTPPTPPVPNAAPPAQPDDTGFETDFADLAARFAAKSGGGLSPELSTDLALEIVLNEIVEQACLATGATGAAIVLRRDNDMICRATSGTTSPDLGSRLDMSEGLSGECVKTLRTVRSDDVLIDKRADVDASLRLGVRSVMVMPLLRGTELAGAFEIFSSRVNAFGDRDERTLEALATRTLKNLARAMQARVAPAANREEKQADAAIVAPTNTASTQVSNATASADKAVLDRKLVDQESAIRTLVLAADQTASVEESKIDQLKIEESKLKESKLEEPTRKESSAIALTGGGPPDGSWLKYDVTTLALTAAVAVCLLMLGFVVAKDLQLRQRDARVHAAPKVAAAKAVEPASTPSPVSTSGNTPVNADTAPATAAQQSNGITIRPAGRGEESSVPPGGLRVYENGREVFRLAPSPAPADTSSADKSNVVQRAAAIEPDQTVQLSPEAAEGSLVRRVEPQYPDQALARKIQGAVVLDVRIRSNGAVEGVQVISGDPLLAQASTDAVKQWRFRPHTQNGLPAQMETQVTLNFRLPQ